MQQSDPMLSLAEVRALVAQGANSRLGFSVFVGLLAATITSWLVVALWIVLVTAWELLARSRLEEWALSTPAGAGRPADAEIRLACVYALGTVLYSGMGWIGFLSEPPLAHQLAMGWVAGSAIHTFVYFSNRARLLAANLFGPFLAALIGPTLAAGELSWLAALSTIVTLTLFASAALFAVDRNAMLAQLAQKADAARAAEEANAAKTKFLRVIGHELRTPLNAVIGYAELLEEDLARMKAEQQRSDAAQITAAGKRLLSLINDIVSLSQKEANAPLLKDVETDINALIEEFSVAAHDLAAASGNRFTLSAEPLPAAIIDREKLVDCLLALIGVACEHTRAGVITLRAWSDEGILFEVIGAGPNWGGATRDQSFNAPDAQGRVTRLEIARKDASLMGGEISAEDTPEGAAFTLWLPLNVQADAA